MLAVHPLDDLSFVDSALMSVAGSVFLPSPSSLAFTASSSQQSSSSSSSSLSSGSPSPPGTAPSSTSSVRVRHDKQRRNASEVRRRGEMRDAFRALQTASRCTHAGRYSVLTHATHIITQMQQRDRERERDSATATVSGMAGRQLQQHHRSGSMRDQNSSTQASVDEQSEAPAMLLPFPLPAAASSASSPSSSHSTSSSSAPSSPSLSMSSSAIGRSSHQLCALTVCQWLPIACCVCELNGALLAVNPALLQLLDCPSVAFCLQRAHSLYELIDTANALSTERVMASQQQQHPQSGTVSVELQPTSAKRVKSEDGGGSASGLKYESVAVDVTSCGGSGIDLVTDGLSSVKPASLPLPIHSLAVHRADIPSSRVFVSHSSSASQPTRQPPPSAAHHSSTAPVPAPRLTHSAVVSLLAVSGAMRPAQLSVSMASIRDNNTNEWRAAIICMFVALPTASAATGTVTTAAASDTRTAATDIAGDEDEDWGNASGGAQPLTSSSTISSHTATQHHYRHQQLEPQSQHHQPSLFSSPSAVLPWLSHPAVDRPSPPPLSLQWGAPDQPTIAPSTFSSRHATLAADRSFVNYPPPTAATLPPLHSSAYPALHRLSALHGYTPYSESDHQSAASAPSSAPLPHSSTPTSVSSSAALFSSADFASIISPYTASVLSPSPSFFAATQQQLSTSNPQPLSPKSLAHRLLSNRYR